MSLNWSRSVASSWISDVDRLGEQLVALPDLLGDLRAGVELALDTVEALQIVGLLAHACVVESSASSTTSASTISSSLTDPAPDVPVWPDADVPAALASRAAAS